MHGRLFYERSGANADGADSHDSHSAKKEKIVGVEHPDDNRAAVVLEKMGAEGINGPSDGTSRPREVFIPRINSE